MKRIVLLVLICLSCANTYAQKVNADSLTYQLQREKINNMLDARKKKFGQYDQSLRMHTGIFGLQTKKDIRRSNDLLMDIVKTDDDIFRELKILLDYRTFQQQQVQSHSAEAENSNLGFMNTINRLRQQTDKLKQDVLLDKQQQEKTQRTYFIVFVLMLGSILYLLIKKRTVKV
jgi:hypothetical protein